MDNNTSFVLSGQGIKSLEILEIEILNKSKTLVYIDLSNNQLR